MPGLVNCHTHSAMTGLRGIRDDSNLHEWLEDYIWPAEAEFTPEMTTKAVKEALTEMLQSGTTTFNDMYNPNGVDIVEILWQSRHPRCVAIFLRPSFLQMWRRRLKL